MDEKEFIAKKMKILMGEKKYNKDQAYAISKSYYERENNHAQQGLQKAKSIYGREFMFPITRIENSVVNGIEGYKQFYSDPVKNKEDFSFMSKEDFERKMKAINSSNQGSEDYEPYLAKYLKTTQNKLNQTVSYQEGGYAQLGMYNMTLPSMSDINLLNQNQLNPAVNTYNQPTYSPGNYKDYDINNDGIPDLVQNLEAVENKKTANIVNNSPQEEVINTRYNIANPYGGIDLNTALNYTGQQFGKGNTLGGVLGGSLSLFKGAREFMSGFGAGKENQRVKNEYFDNIFGEKPNYVYAQQGAKITNADFLTGQYALDEGSGNVNVEGNEYLNRQGNVQQVIGEPHVKNGKKAEGVNVNLSEGDKVLSDYTKIPAKSVKELKERYNLSLKKGATFADAQKAYDKKLGIQKVTDELSEYIEKLGANESVKDETTKRLNTSIITKEIQEYKEKLDELKQPQAMFFDKLFSIQETIPKKGGGKELLDKNGKVIKEEGEYAQQGTEVNQDAQVEELIRQGMSHQEAMQQVQSQPQEGGDQIEQIYQYVAQALQQGADPQQLAQELVSSGVPQEIVGQVIQEVASQMQNRPMQEQSMQQGGIRVASKYENPELFKKQNPTAEDWQTFGELLKNDPEQVLGEIKRIHPELYDKYFKDNKIPDYSKIRSFQEDVNKKYEDIRKDYVKVYGENSQEVKDLNKYIESDKFLPENRQYDEKQDRIVNKEVRGIDSYLGNWTSTRPNFAINVLPKEELAKVRSEGVNTAWELKQRFPELYDKYVKSKDLSSDFWLEEVPTTPTKKEDTTDYTSLENKPQIPVEKTETVMPWLPQALRLAPSSLDPLAKEQINLPRLEPIKLTAEPMLAEQERLRQTDVSRVQSAGLTPQQQEALLASGLSASQMASNDAISKVEMANQQNQYQVDQYNAGQTAKEDITNAQFRQDYQNKALGSLNAYERDLRNFYTQNYLDQAQKFKDIENINLLNAKTENYAYIPGQGVKYMSTQSADYSTPNLNKAIGDLTVDEENIFKQEFTRTGSYKDALRKAKGY